MTRFVRIKTLIVIATVAIALDYKVSVACQCAVHDYGFLVPHHVELPANSVGVPWWSMDQTVPTNSDFSVERLDSEGIVSVDFELRVLQDPFKNNDYPYPYDQFVLVAPVNGFVPGAVYRFTCKRRHQLPIKAKEHMADRQLVEVTISHRDFAPNPGKASVEVGKLKYGRLTVSTTGGMCSTEIATAMTRISLLLPRDLEVWRNALLYTVIVDGKTMWHPSKSLCDPVPPGMSWIGKGEDLVFSWCQEDGFEAPPIVNIESGRRRIEFNAWLPGTGLIVSGSKEIELNCLEEVELYRFDDTTD